MPAMLPPILPSGTTQYKWIDPTGAIRDLTPQVSPKLFVAAGSVGMGASSFDIDTTKLPSSPGVFIRHINTEARELEIPIFIKEDSFGELVNTMEDLHEWFDTGDETSKRPGTFMIIRPDGQIRTIQLYYKSGLEGDLSEGTPTHVKYSVSFISPDPAWISSEIFLVLKSNAEMASNFGIMNMGKLPTYPVWTFTGPFTVVNITNVTTGQPFSSTAVLTAGQTLTIDTRPEELRNGPSIYDQTGASRLSTVFPNSEFFTLQPGLNEINIEFFGDNTVATTLQVAYYERYRSALR